MSAFQHIRHKESQRRAAACRLVIACAPLRSNVNLSRIVRAAGCFGISRVYVTGRARINKAIARDGAEAVEIESHRSLAPVLKRLQSDGYELVGLEQTTDSECLYEAAFRPDTCLVVGNERLGLADDILAILDRVVEIPVYGRPHSHNVASATIMAMYEYCRQVR